MLVAIFTWIKDVSMEINLENTSQHILILLREVVVTKSLRNYSLAGYYDAASDSAVNTVGNKKFY